MPIRHTHTLPWLKQLFAVFVAGMLGMPLQAGKGAASPFDDDEGNILPPYLCCENAWVDSVMTTLSLDQQIGQLFMVAAWSNKDEDHQQKILELVRESGIGGLIFMKGGPVRQARLVNIYQEAAQVKLMVAMDAEWGLAMRLDSTVRYPRQMTLGAMRSEMPVERMGADIARQMRRLGVHVSFSPVADINNNPANPVIGSRSFGEDRENVSRKAIAYMKGLQGGQVLANAKHFPGHGDTDKDSHLALPVVNHDRARLNKVELYPFRALIDAGIGSIMVAHLSVPALDATKNRATTLSPKVVNGLLKKEMNFRGLVFTDALNMKGVSDYHEPGAVDVKALLAGNDVLLFSEDVPKAIAGIRKAIDRGEITREAIEEKCRNILMAKYWMGLHQWQPVVMDRLVRDLNDTRYDYAQATIAESAVTLVKNKGNLLPLQRPDTLTIASVVVGGKTDNTFQEMLRRYGTVEVFYLSKEARKEEIARLIRRLEKFNLVIISVHDPSHRPSSNFGIKSSTVDLVEKLSAEKTVVLDIFANPYVLGRLPGLMAAHAVIVSYEDLYWLQSMSAQAIWGAIPFKGSLPVTASAALPVGTGLETKSLHKLRYGVPESSGMNPSGLDRIDTIVQNAIGAGAFPGCQVLAARNGQVFYHKAFGHHKYDGKRPVRTDDLYDLASITKIAATTAALMRLVDEGKIRVDDSLGMHLAFPDSCNKSGIILRDLLTHQAGLEAWIPFWQETMDGNKPSRTWYRPISSSRYPWRVTRGMYMRADYPDTIMKRIHDSPLSTEKTYLYSDLGYYYVKQIIEQYAGMPMERYVDSLFYSPMGLVNTTFRPYQRLPDDRVAPTENDLAFRRQLIQGDVHDPGAAMMGGVGGHAGLFSDASGLAAIMHMFLQKGTYGGKRYISAETLQEFTRCQYCINENRRGIGFDKPEPDPGKGGPSCKCASYLSFGHSGFTGTLAWVDPENGLLYVFLSNRIHPDAENKKIMEMNVRTDIQEILYNAVYTLPAAGK